MDENFIKNNDNNVNNFDNDVNNLSNEIDSVNLNNNTVNEKNGKKKRGFFLKAVIIVVIVLFAFSAYQVADYTNIATPQWFMDRYVVANFEPSEQIKTLVENSGMSDKGEFYFYTGQPELNTAEMFNINCAELLNEETNILGCYNGRIYIFNVTDERIAGITNVTAAHEMLHAAYDRLGVADKAWLDELIEKELAITTDENVLELVELYANLEPGQEIYELHSIFGTESANLSSELEEYYDRYFSDRTKVLSENQKYRAVFDELEQQANEIDAKMQILNNEIEILQSQYLSNTNQLNYDIDNFNLRADSGYFSTMAEFNTERNRLVNRQNTLDAQLNTLNAKIDEYNGYVEDLRALGRAVEALNSELDSKSVFLQN